MALTDPRNTLAYHMSRVLVSHRDMSHISCKACAPQVGQYQKHGGSQTKPDMEAIEFYGMNHGMALITANYAPYEPLPEDVLEFVEHYFASMNDKALRAFYYLLIICIREARHTTGTHKKNSQAKTVPKCGPAAWAYLDVVPQDATSAMNEFAKNPPDCTLSQLTEMLMGVFFHGGWSGGFGGKKWGVVTQCAHRFITGEFSAEMMLDTVWTLAHNGGPIFNKGMLYVHYSGELIKILDVQRSGQIPELVLEGEHCSAHVSPNIKKRMQWLTEKFPGQLGEYVDWYKVQALGAVGNYSSEQENQIATYGGSEQASAAQKAAAEMKKIEKLKKQQKLEEAAAAEAEFKLTNFLVAPKIGNQPEVWLKKVSRAA